MKTPRMVWLFLRCVPKIMVANSSGVEQIQDPGYLVYTKNAEYQYIDSWFVIDVDLSEFSGN